MEAARHNKLHSTGKDEEQEHEEVVVAVEGGVEINAAGHRDQLKRQYNLWALTGMALTIDNAWAALGSSIAVSIAYETSLLLNDFCMLRDATMRTLVLSFKLLSTETADRPALYTNYL